MPTYLSPGVYIEEKEGGSRPLEGVGTAVAAFVGQTEKGPVNQPTLVTSWSQYVDVFGEFTPTGYTPLSVYHFFNNGGGSAYIVRVGASGNGRQAALPTAMPVAELASAAKPGTTSYRVLAVDPDKARGLSVEIRPQPVSPKPDGGDGADNGEDQLFTLVVKQGGQQAEVFRDLTPRKTKQNAVTVVAEQSKLIVLEDVSGGAIAERVPAPGEVPLAIPPRVMAETQAQSEDIVGDPSARSGLGGLEALDDITMVAVPDLMAAYQSGAIDLEGVKVVQRALIDHCENMGNRMAILDTPPDLNAQQVKDWRMEATGFDSRFATMYWPWIKVFNPGSGMTEFLPPSGAIAGLWGRNDDARGVHKAPANEVVRGAVDLALNITRNEHDQLNPIGVNVIRSFPGRGIRVWGARTLSSDPAWRYINVRRLFNFLETSIMNGTQWVVFEPNDKDLWARITRVLEAFLRNVWRTGALFGSTANEAFYVKCDSDTNPPSTIDAGQVNIEIGICPVKPAEFVVFRLAQLPTGGAVEEG
jgi:hypothetical protein